MSGYWSRGNLVEGRDDRLGKDIACTRCGRLPSKKGHDWCLRNLPGVQHACCGHGEEDGYIQFENGVTIKGPFTVHPGIEPQGD